jgi:hypothetical protein
VAEVVCLAKRHGTHHAYRAHRCRCPETLAFMAQVQREGRARRAAGVSGNIDPTATHRMIKALFAAGWTGTEMSARLGYRRPWTAAEFLASKQVNRKTEEKIRGLYDALQATPGPSKLNQQRSKLKGWATPFAWDDDTIGDPQAEPVGRLEPSKGHKDKRTLRRTRELLYEYDMIRGSGMTHEWALREMNIREDTYEAAVRRAAS